MLTNAMLIALLIALVGSEAFQYTIKKEIVRTNLRLADVMERHTQSLAENATLIRWQVQQEQDALDRHERWLRQMLRDDKPWENG